MALVSPGVQVTVTDESFFVPAQAPTVPLLFVATAAEKTQDDGVTPAAATFESNVVRTVTSLTQSTELYGIPRFLTDDAGTQLHGDARNEYGLFALNQYLGIGDRAFVVRADVNLDDDLDNLRAIWNSKQQEASILVDNLVTDFITEFNQVNGFVPSNPLFKVTVTDTEFLSIAREATDIVWDFYSFRNSEENFFDDNSTPAAATAGSHTVNFNGDINQGRQIINFDALGQGFGAINSATRFINIDDIAVTGTETTNLTGGSPSLDVFQLRVFVDGTLNTINMVGANITTWNDLVNELNAQLLPGAFAQLVDGNLRIVSATNDPATSSIAILDGVTGGSPFARPLLAALPDFVAVEDQLIGAATPTTLPNNGTSFTVSVTIDGGSAQLLTVQGQNAQTYADLETQLNGQLLGGTLRIFNGNLEVESDSTVAGTSSVAIADVSLLAALYAGFATGSPATTATQTAPTIDPATGAAGSPLSYTNPTGLANDATVYSANVTIDGIPRTIQITGSAAQTFDALITEINADLTTPLAGSASITEDGSLVITSSSTGAFSTVVISDVDLFSSITGFVGLATPVAGLPGDSALDVYRNGYDLPPTGSYDGLEGIVATWVANSLGAVVPGEFTAEEAAGVLLAAADDYQFTVEFLNETSLGANDNARRVAIVTALQAAINSNTEVRSDAFEFNLILAPGYHEVVDEMVALSVDIGEEAMVIADTPMTLDPTEVVAWSETTERQRSESVAYYYPAGLASNLDGVNVVVAASGIALRTYAFSDNVSELWFAPAGTRRGLVTGVTSVGYADCGASGCSTPSEFVEVNLNQGQRDDLYKFFTNINPIVFFPGRGILVFGQKTSASAASARDRVNVERLIEFVRRQLRKNLLPFVFEPNDTLTRDSVKALVDNFLGDLVIRRGLLDFATICDESNNTPDRIDRNELYVDIALQPVKAAEFIFVPIRIVATGAEI